MSFLVFDYLYVKFLCDYLTFPGIKQGKSVKDKRKKLCGLYRKVSTEEQTCESFSLTKQKEKLETFCKFKDYEIVGYYKDAGVSTKTGNLRP